MAGSGLEVIDYDTQIHAAEPHLSLSCSILSKIYNKDRMNVSEKNFLSQSESTVDELMKAQQEIAAESALDPSRSQLIATEIIERLTEQKKNALGGSNSRGVQK